MREFTFLIPEREDTSRKLHSAQKWHDLEKKLLAAFGGFTRQGIVGGSWADDDGNIIEDTSRKYSICGESTSCWALLAAILTQSKLDFDQQCIYVAETSLAVVLY